MSLRFPHDALFDQTLRAPTLLASTPRMAEPTRRAFNAGRLTVFLNRIFFRRARLGHCGIIVARAR